MVRPKRCRRVLSEPEVIYFKPTGKPLRELEEITLHVEEFEAVRLNDLEKLGQEKCADKMGVSQPTFNRVLSSARTKIAEALSKGKAIRIEGGNYSSKK